MTNIKTIVILTHNFDQDFYTSKSEARRQLKDLEELIGTVKKDSERYLVYTPSAEPVKKLNVFRSALKKLIETVEENRRTIGPAGHDYACVNSDMSLKKEITIAAYGDFVHECMVGHVRAVLNDVETRGSRVNEIIPLGGSSLSAIFARRGWAGSPFQGTWTKPPLSDREDAWNHDRITKQQRLDHLESSLGEVNSEFELVIRNSTKVPKPVLDLSHLRKKYKEIKKIIEQNKE